MSVESNGDICLPRGQTESELAGRTRPDLPLSTATLLHLIHSWDSFLHHFDD